MLRLEIKLTTNLRKLDAVEERLKNAEKLWDHLYDSGLPSWFERTFQTDGFGSWEETSRPNPILRDTRRYESSFIGKTADTVDRRGRSDWIFGSNVEYGHYHEEGTSRLPIRAVPGSLAEQSEFDDWVKEETEKFIEAILE